MICATQSHNWTDNHHPKHLALSSSTTDPFTASSQHGANLILHIDCTPMLKRTRSKRSATWGQRVAVLTPIRASSTCEDVEDKRHSSINTTDDQSVWALVVQCCHSLANWKNSPGPAPAPEPELLPSDLSSDWPTGGEVGMVNMKIQGMEGRRGSNNKNHTQGLVAHENVWSHRA